MVSSLQFCLCPSLMWRHSWRRRADDEGGRERHVEVGRQDAARRKRHISSVTHLNSNLISCAMQSLYGAQIITTKRQRLGSISLLSFRKNKIISPRGSFDNASK